MKNEAVTTSRDTLTGSRIRERRTIAGLKQADLARQVGISPSYLNLIEHNRRRIGGKLLVDIARVLAVEPSMLSEGAEAALIAALREAAADAGPIAAEADRAEEFAGRFPGWAEVLSAAHRRIATLERTVEILSDRLAHDPHLATSLHEVLSTAAAIRSTASILAETGELEAEWRDKFHRNLNEDSRRLSESSKALVSYLDESGDEAERLGSPREEVENFLSERGYHFPDLEAGEASIDSIVQAAPGLRSEAARRIAAGQLQFYKSDAALLPAEKMAMAIEQKGLSPLDLAEAFQAPLDAVFRRLAVLPEKVVGGQLGLVVCDGAGSLLLRKPVEGFAVPRFGSACPLWPLFGALSRPHTPLRQRLVQGAGQAAAFDCMAIAHPVIPADFGRDPLFHATMLIRPIARSRPDPIDITEVGSSCRVCPRLRCPARREPSILKEGF